jgi:hypothetical protein
MRWHQDQSGRWYIEEADGTVRWPTQQEEADRVRAMGYREPAFRPFQQGSPTEQFGPSTAYSAYSATHEAASPRQRRPWGLAVATGIGGLIIGIGIGIGIGAAGSGGSDTSTVSGGAPGSSSAPGSRSAAAASGDKRTEDNPAFGQTVTFKDKSTLTCAKPVKFKRDESALGGEKSAVFLKVKCTFTNRSGQTFDPTLTTVSMSAAGIEGDSVYQGDLDTPDNPVLNGKSVTWWSGYGVTANKDVQFSVNIGFLEYPTITFS